LDAENFKEFKLVQKNQISHNVAKFKFALPAPTSVLGLPIGQHISCRFGHILVSFLIIAKAQSFDALIEKRVLS
jgi:hypothetical protein